MKIIQVIPSLELAGAETMCENLSYALDDLGHEVFVVSLYDKSTPITKRLIEKNINVIFLGKKSGIDLKCLFKLKKIFKEIKPDIVHSHLYASTYAFIAASLTHIKKIVHTVHNVANKESSKLTRMINNFYFKRDYVRPIALNEITRQSIIEYYHLDDHKVITINNGINFEKCIEKKDYKIKDEIKILNIARFSKQKNHNRLIDAFNICVKQYPNSKLQLIGIGPELEDIQNKVKRLGIENKVEFLFAQDNVYKYLNEADIFVLSSDYEGMPMTLIEAMGTGIPIVATSVGGIPNILNNNETALLSETNETKLAECIMKLVCCEELRVKLGLASIKDSKKYSSEEMAKNYLEVYRR